MAGLVSYASSDEEDVGEENVSQNNSRSHNNNTSTSNPLDSRKQASLPTDGISSVQLAPESSPNIEGPIVGPTIPDQALEMEVPEDSESASVPQSPYSTNRALLRDLTLPTVPNYDIPGSPPGSPIESTNAKFKQFLKLKKQGIHFNEKLANSAAMKNPDLMQKLLDFANVDDSEQYVTALPPALWDPHGFPGYAYKEQLSKSQQRIGKKKEEEKSSGQRESIDFVPSTTSNNSSRTGTPGLASRNTGKSAAERVMAGLDKGRSNSPQVQGVKRKSRFDT